METKHFSKIALSLFLVLVMALSLIGVLATPSEAAEEYTGTGTFEQCTGNLTSGYYVFGVGTSAASISALNTTATSNWIKFTTTTSTSGKITNPDSSIVWYYDAAAGTFKNGTNYVAWQTTGNSAVLNATGTPLTVTETSTEGVYNITVTATSDRNLRLNSTSGYRFYTSNTGTNTFYFFKLAETTGGDGGETHTHSYTSNVTTAASCTEAGTKTYSCECGDSYTETIPAAGHNYVDGVCTVCKESQPTMLTIVRDSFGDASGYAWHAWSATATTGETISGSGFIYGSTTTSMQMNGGNKGDYIYNTTPLPGKIVSITLTKASGTDRYFDILLSDAPFDSATSALLKNQATDAKKLVTTEGVTWTFEASHKYFAVVLTDSSAAYLSSIVIEYEISTNTCEHTNKVAIGEAKAATCTEEGITAGEKCADCGEVIIGQAPIPATGHSTTASVTTPATCTAAGTKTVTCANCDYSATEEIPAAGHNYLDGICSVCGELSPVYEKVEIADITANDKIIIVSTNKDGNSYAMSNGNGTSSAPTAVSVTVTDNKIYIDNADILWNIVNDNGNLTIYLAGTTNTWLYCTSTNNGVRVGDNDSKVFTIDSSTGYLKHTGTSRYLGVYNNQDWRCYTNTTGNTKDQTFAFYREVKPVCPHSNTKALEGKDATCTGTGLSAGLQCVDCDAIITEQQTLPALGHTPGTITCTTAQTCKVCGTELAAASGHNYENGICRNEDCEYYKVSFVNSFGWENVSAYVWSDDVDNSWPGAAMTATGETVNGFTVYSVELNGTYENIIFNNNNNGKQTDTLVLEKGKLYSIDSISTGYYLVGDFNEWAQDANELRIYGADGSIGSLTLTLKAGTYGFKVKHNDTWLGNNGAFTDTASGWTMSGYEDNCKLTVSKCGDYTFSFDISTNKLTVSRADNDNAHTWNSGDVTAPTCTAGGYTTYTCASCNHSYTTDKTSAKGHTPAADDGDCTTATLCTVCGEIAIDAPHADHAWDNACDTDCNNSGCNKTRTASHTPNPDDGNCETAITCSVCGVETTAAKQHTFTNACDKTCNNADCLHTRTITHMLEADDGDCTTAIICSVCKEEVTPAKQHTFTNACDATCNNSGCNHTRTTSHTPEADDGNCESAITCSVCGVVTTPAVTTQEQPLIHLMGMTAIAHPLLHVLLAEL